MRGPVFLYAAGAILAIGFLLTVRVGYSEAQSPRPEEGAPVLSAPADNTTTLTPALTPTASPTLTVTATATATPTPTLVAAQIKRVDFTNNLEVRRDRLHDSIQRIHEFDGDTIEWKADKCDGVTNKNWPVGYPRLRQLELDIDLCVRLQGVESITGTVRGSTVLSGTNLSFEKPGVTLVNGVNHVAGFQSQAPRVQSVSFEEQMAIRWSVSGDFGTVDAGTSSHNVYITLREPRINPLSQEPYPIYFSLVHWTTHAANQSSLEIEVVDDVETDLTSRRIERRDFDPVTGRINAHQALLHYWNDVSPGQSLKDIIGSGLVRTFRCGLHFTTEALLETTDGRCGAWARFEQHALGIHGIAADRVHLGVGSQGCVAKSERCAMLVRRWGFVGEGTSMNPVYPYTWAEVFDEPGVAGQGVSNPPPLFWDHAIVRTNGRTGPHYFDPSYGTGPFSTLEKYEFASMEGFCRPLGPKFKGPYECQKDPPGQELQVIP